MAESRSAAHVAYGSAIREFRHKIGLSQEELATDAELDRTYVSGIERGERNPSLANLLKLAEALNVRFSEIAARAEAIARASTRR